MSKANISGYPYHDDYDSSKGYTQLLAIPGRNAQAREFTQMQTVVKDIIKSVGDSIMSDGDIVEGCQVSLVKEGEEITGVNVSSGRVYINGMVLPLGEQAVKLIDFGIVGDATRNFTVGIVLNEEIVTEVGDNTLRDPAQDYPNYNMPGCHRLKSTVQVVINDPTAAVLVEVINGSIKIDRYAGNYDNLTRTLARRTYDESGSYIVSGLGVRVEYNDEETYNVVVDAGKAYVLGYELSIPASRRVEKIPRSTTTGLVVGAIYTYEEGKTEYELDDNPYVDSVASIVGRVETTKKDLSKNTDGRIKIGNNPATEVVSVKLGDSDISNYSLTRDGSYYYLSIPDNPSNGPYTITYTYDYTFTNGTDYELLEDNKTIKWIGSVKPIENTKFTVTYNQYLARKDVVSIDRYGEIVVTQGISAEYGYEVLPDAPSGSLPIAYIMNPPRGEVTVDNPDTRISVSNIGLTRFTMNDIQNLLNRIRTMEYDQAVLALNNEAKFYDTVNDKRGVFTDPLIDLSRMDYDYDIEEEKEEEDGKKIKIKINNNNTIDLVNSLCYLPTLSKEYDLKLEDINLLGGNSKVITLPKSKDPNIILSQPKATKLFQVNPYTSFPELPEISITPSGDTWIDDTIIEIPVSMSTNEIVSSSINNIERYNTSGSRRADTVTSTSTLTSIGTRVEQLPVSESIIEEKAVQYIRKRTVSVSGSKFPPNAEIRGFFDGKPIQLTKLNNDNGIDIISTTDKVGKFSAEFEIPENVPTGIREVKIELVNSEPGYERYALALYQASGIARTINRTVTTLTTILLHRITTVTTTHNIDPVGQTFILDRMTLLSGVRLYFGRLGNAPITCEIRGVENGTINSTVYGHKTIVPPSEENSPNVDKPGEPTIFRFDDPVLLEGGTEYAVVVRSTSTVCSLWVAELGEEDKTAEQIGEGVYPIVLSNPYLVGNMLSSSNNSSWTVHQTTDIKFDLLEDEYSDSALTVQFDINEENVEDFSRIYLLADTLTPPGTSIKWYYSVGDSSIDTEISPYSISHLSSVENNIKFKATLKNENSYNISPMLICDSLGVALSKYDSDGAYVSKPITGLDKYNHVDIILDTYIDSTVRTESGKSIDIKVYIVYISKDDETLIDTINTIELTHDTSKDKAMSYRGWVERVYSTKLSNPANNCRIFIKFHSDFAYSTPAFRRLRAIMSYDERNN